MSYQSMPKVPAWMAQMKAERDAERQRAQSETQATDLLSVLMQTDQPCALWNRLANELRRLAGLSLKHTGFNVSVGEPASSSSELRVTATRPGLPVAFSDRPHSAYINVFYAPEERRIRCHPQFSDDAFYFEFCPFRDSLTLCCHGQATGPEDAASAIVENLVRTLRSEI
jgi:hypothetical protein